MISTKHFLKEKFHCQLPILFRVFGDCSASLRVARNNSPLIHSFWIRKIRGQTFHKNAYLKMFIYMFLNWKALHNDHHYKTESWTFQIYQYTNLKHMNHLLKIPYYELSFNSKLKNMFEVVFISRSWHYQKEHNVTKSPVEKRQGWKIARLIGCRTVSFYSWLLSEIIPFSDGKTHFQKRVESNWH